MEFVIGEDAAALADAVGEFFDRRGDARMIADASSFGSAVSRSRWDALCGMGLPALRVAEPAGVGASLLDSTVVAERLGAVLLPEPASVAIVLARVLTDVPASSRIVCLAAQPALSAGLDGSITGRVRTADDDVTELVVVPVDGAHPGMAVFERADLGDAVQRCDVDPSRPTAIREVDNAVPVVMVPMAPEQIASLLREWAVLTVAELVGAMREVMDSTTAFAIDRKQFGRSIGSFQVIKHQLADMYVSFEQGRAAAQFAATSCDRGAETAAADVAASARWVPAAAIALFERALHIHGAMGYSWEVGVHLHLRRAAATRTLLRESGVTAPQLVRVAS